MSGGARFTGLPIMDALEQQQYWEQTLRQPRYADEKRLLLYGAKAYSQNDEDGILAEIFRRIGIQHRSFIEIGTESGIENNTVALLFNGWRGLWLDANEASIAAINERFGSYLKTGRLRAEQHFVTRDNVNLLLASAGLEPEIDLLSIDVDGNDYWIWQAISSPKPRVVVIEYNATWFPPLALTIAYQENFRWDNTSYFGASLKALELLGASKGYSLVGCCFAGVNAFFVRSDLCQDRFCEPCTAENHFEPPRYWMVRPAGHPPGIGPVEIVS
jgi:hypothetical protein